MFVIWSCDPSGRLQRPEQHGSSFGAWQAGLFFDAPFKLFTQPLDGAGGSRAFSLAGRQSVLTATPVENGYVSIIAGRPFAPSGSPARQLRPRGCHQVWVHRRAPKVNELRTFGRPLAS
jgi:hypothetical protein